MNEDTCCLHYTKRNNTELFEQLKEENLMNMESIQNYIPIYTRYFNLNNTNYESVNLNHPWYIKKILRKNSETDYNVELCNLSETIPQTKNNDVFCKIVPLNDPYKYLVGKSFNDEQLYNIPTFVENNESNVCLTDVNNSAYVDGMFVYFTNLLQSQTNFVHGISYYGSFIGIKKNLSVNIFDDLEYLHNSTFFNNHKNKDFRVEDYSFLINDILENGSNKGGKLPPIVIGKNSSLKSIHSFDDNIYDGLFEDTLPNIDKSNVANSIPSENILHLSDLSDELEVIDIVNETNESFTLDDKSDCTSDCSSRTSHTSSSCDEDSENSSEESEWSDETESNGLEEKILANIPIFPVELIFMEKMHYTLDTLMEENELDNDELFSIFMQIIMTLITYQHVFSFTHNDLHSSNIMFIETKKKFLYYKYKNIFYKVPTFGRIVKVIDFGRGIYQYNNTIMCSDSFKPGSDASTQYNTEPYFNSDKPRIEPNFSFDLCRLACSIFDDFIEDVNEIGDDPVCKIVNEWCLDDNGTNVLYKSSGEERYPSFKLYKMIARQVHNHTPTAQLSRPEFSKYAIKKKDVEHKMMKHVMDIDNFPLLKNEITYTNVK
jgi:hypothetical protein